MKKEKIEAQIKEVELEQCDDDKGKGPVAQNG
jgi:hypothetical protein